MIPSTKALIKRLIKTTRPITLDRTQSRDLGAFIQQTIRALAAAKHAAARAEQRRDFADSRCMHLIQRRKEDDIFEAALLERLRNPLPKAIKVRESNPQKKRKT